MVTSKAEFPHSSPDGDKGPRLSWAAQAPQGSVPGKHLLAPSLPRCYQSLTLTLHPLPVPRWAPGFRAPLTVL